MGVVHKLKSQIIDFILESKEQNPSLSCRKIVPLIWKKFRMKVSKSSVNLVLQGAGSNAPVGRHSETFIDCAGAFFLKGADIKIGASVQITRAVCDQIDNLPQRTIQAYNETLIFMGMFGIKDPSGLRKYKNRGLWHLAGLKYNKFLISKIIDYYNLLSDKKLYYNIAMRLVSLYTGLSGFAPVFSKEDNFKGELSPLLFNLHKYCQMKFFPPAYQNASFSQMNQQFYSLGGFIRKTKSGLIIRFSQYKHLDLEMDIAYACKKFNNPEIISSSGQRLYIQPII